MTWALLGGVFLGGAAVGVLVMALAAISGREAHGEAEYERGYRAGWCAAFDRALERGWSLGE